MSRSSLAAGFAPKPLPKLAARTVVAELVAGRFENAASLADDARLVVNMFEVLYCKVKLRAVERGITIREYPLRQDSCRIDRMTALEAQDCGRWNTPPRFGSGWSNG